MVTDGSHQGVGLIRFSILVKGTTPPAPENCILKRSALGTCENCDMGLSRIKLVVCCDPNGESSMSPSTEIDIKPFVIDLDQNLLSDLRDRLAKTRIPACPVDSNWSAGANPDYLKELLNFWQYSFEWRKRETSSTSFLISKQR